MTEIHNSPRRFVAKHIERYLESGESTWHGVPSLLLTTTGRKSGLKRRTAMIFREVEEGYIVIASQGGEPVHPNWYFNIESDPHVEVQVGHDRFPAEAEVLDGENRKRCWDLMVDMWPEFTDYQARTTRRIPVLLLRRAAT